MDELEKLVREAMLLRGIRIGLKAAASAVEGEIIRPEECLIPPNRKIAARLTERAECLKHLAENILRIDPEEAKSLYLPDTPIENMQ